MVTIKDFTEDSIVLDEDDPLAGKTLTFKIELVDFIVLRSVYELHVL